MQQGRLLLPAIDQLLKHFNLLAQDLDAIAIGVGPGSFTGLRLSSAVVQGLSYAANCPVYPISSLAILAQTAYKKNGCEQQFVGLDARMQQLYLSVYRLDVEGIMRLQGQEMAHQVDSIDSKVLMLDRALPCFAIGGAWETYLLSIEKQLSMRFRQVDADVLPSAEAALEIAKANIKQGMPALSSFDVLPSYLS